MNKTVLAIIVVVVLAIGGAWLAMDKSNTNSSQTPQTSNSTQQKTQSNAQNIKPTGENEISIQNFSFSPASLTVKKGKTVTWINQDSVPHTATENDGKNGPSSPQLANGEKYTFTFNEVGVFHYHCSLHSNMTGVVTVVE